MTFDPDSLLEESDVSPEEVEDKVLIVLIRDEHRDMASTAILAALANQYDFPVRGRLVHQALKSLRDQHLVYRRGNHWCISTINLARRDRL